MASSHDSLSMAVFCDFENVALGVRDANYEKFDIKPVLERLLLKGSIVVKKAYCDWDRYKGFKAAMHEANFELIEIPHVRQSGKNSADIRMVVDALDLCYTKSHVNTFVIISGDSDFSPLVSKLRENAKQVIAVGVKQSTSDLLVANCDEFIFYDDLVREKRRTEAKRDERKAQPAAKRSADESSRRKEELDVRKTQAIDMAVETFDALVSERGDSGKIWASMLKEAIKRRKPDFSESYYGFRTFGNLLEEAQARGLLEFGRDEKSGAFVYRSSAAAAAAAAASEAVLEHAAPVAEARAAEVADVLDAADAPEVADLDEANGNTLDGDVDGNQLDSEVNGNRKDAGGRGRNSNKPQDGRRNGRGGRNTGASLYRGNAASSGADAAPPAAVDVAPEAVQHTEHTEQPVQAEPARGRGSRRKADYRGSPAVTNPPAVAQAASAPVAQQPVAVEVAMEVAQAPSSEPGDDAAAQGTAAPRRNARGGRKPAAKTAATAQPPGAAPVAAAVVIEAPVGLAPDQPSGEEAASKPARKPAARSRRPRKADSAE